MVPAVFNHVMKKRIGILTHAADLDGVGSAVLLANLHPDDHVDVRFTEYADMEAKIQEFENLDMLYISDLSFKTADIMDHVRLPKEKVLIFDHHASSKPIFDQIDDRAKIYFDASGKKCTVDLIWDYIQLQSAKLHFGKNLRHLVEATHSIDLWIKNVRDGDLLSDIISMIGPEKTFELLMEDNHRCYEEHFTIGMRKSVELAEEKRQYALAMAMNSHSIVQPFLNEDVKLIVAFTHGYQSDVGNSFLQQHSLAWVVLYDLGKGSASYRTNGYTIAKYKISAKTIAEHFGGGGHPEAAGSPMPNQVGQVGTNQYAVWIADLIKEMRHDNA